MRNEIKYLLKKNEIGPFLKKVKFKNLYPSRFVYSIYFDTKDFANFTLELFNNDSIWSEIRNNLINIRNANNWDIATKKFLIKCNF